MKNTHLTQLDPNQVSVKEHDEQNDAKRVIIVGQDLSGMEEGIRKAVEQGLANARLELPKQDVADQHFNVIEVEKPVYIPQVEYQFVEIPKIVKEIEYREIERPVYITEYKTIEVPVIVKEIQEVKNHNEVPAWVKVLLGSHILTWLGMLISHFIK